ncbi:MAG TPA: hypothetical protein VJ986_02255, partial [Gaiellaceae bacterium]|nr:hypothetical protein [Gaiellaceae bacterium]
MRLPSLRADLVPLACALVAFASAGAAVVASLHWQAWDTTSLVRMHDNLPLAKLASRSDRGFRLRSESGFYDGAYFYAQARDPLATGEAHRLLDEAPYYWGHPGYGWLTWVASAGGRPGAVPDALLAVGLLSILIAGAAASFLSSAVGWTPWGGLTVALNPGLVFAVANDTSEALGSALLLLGLLAHVRTRRGWALAAFAALCFSKEPLVLVPLAIGAWELWRRRPPLTAAAVVPVVGWWFYLRVHLGAFPFGQGSSRLGLPVRGWERALLDA